MKEIIEHFGVGFLQLLGGITFLGIFVACIRPGGVLCDIALAFMTDLCG